MQRSLQFSPVITILAMALGIASPVRAQRGARSFSISSAQQTRPTSSLASGSHAGSSLSTRGRESLRPSTSHSSPVLISGSRFSRTNPRRPRKPVRTLGFYWIFDGGAYWIPAEGEPDVDQSAIDQANVNQISGGQSVDSAQSGPEYANASMQQGSADVTQAARNDSAASQSETPEEASTSLPDEGQFTLVLSDGRSIEAVAFTHSNNTIVYITTAGSRYTIAANELDSDSTLRVNQERGTPLQSPL